MLLISNSTRKAYLTAFVGIFLITGIVLFVHTSRSLQKQERQQELPDEVIVTLTDNGFSPDTVTIHVGSAVRFTNESSTDSASVNSDDYPTNTKNPELNLGIFQRGSTLVHIFNKPGSYSYHDQFEPKHGGSIEVQEN